MPKLFSHSDGTTFKEDLHDIAENVRAFFIHVPVRIKELLPEAEDFVEALEAIAEHVKDGGDADLVIDTILLAIHGTKDEVFYGRARDLFLACVIRMRIALEKAESIGNIKREAVIALIQSLNGATINEAALAIEMVLFAKK